MKFPVPIFHVPPVLTNSEKAFKDVSGWKRLTSSRNAVQKNFSEASCFGYFCYDLKPRGTADV